MTLIISLNIIQHDLYGFSVFNSEKPENSYKIDVRNHSNTFKKPFAMRNYIS